MKAIVLILQQCGIPRNNEMKLKSYVVIQFIFHLRLDIEQITLVVTIFDIETITCYGYKISEAEILGPIFVSTFIEFYRGIWLIFYSFSIIFLYP